MGMTFFVNVHVTMVHFFKSHRGDKTGEKKASHEGWRSPCRHAGRKGQCGRGGPVAIPGTENGGRKRASKRSPGESHGRGRDEGRQQPHCRRDSRSVKECRLSGEQSESEEVDCTKPSLSRPKAPKL